MTRSHVLGAFFLGCAAAACSGSPGADAPDYEVDMTGAHSPSAGSSSSSSGAPAQTDETTTDQASSSSSSGPADTSGDGGAPGSSSSSSGAPGSTTPKPTTVTLTIDGAKYTIQSTDLWAGVSKPGEYDIFIKLTGPGAPTGSDFHVQATHTGTGCNNTTNYLTYRPEGDTQYMPKSTIDAACGLTIDELPAQVGGRFRGSFDGTLYGINTTTPKSKKFALTFDVLREK